VTNVRRVALRAGAFLALLLLSACGFRPLYGERALTPEVSNEMALIDIRPIESRVGLALRNDLLDLLTPLGTPARARYVLAIDLVETRQGLALERDATVTRFNLTLNAEYRLLDAATRQELNAGTARSTAAFNVVRADFANVIADRDAEDRAARVVAEEVVTRLSVFFARRVR
jgi:LPS-assembly lipoprotein